MIPGEGGQQILLDAQTLQGLLKGGGNTITLSGASGKVLLETEKKYIFCKYNYFIVQFCN